MGVPAFFRWLSRKYPSIVVNCVEEKGKIINGVKVPVNASLPNPSGMEFDNLYLDMNGIIHPCCHPEDKPAPKNEDEMMVAIFEYIDRLFAIVRPRKLLYMAIDGVAPRAKMNQQRSRRFRASKETEDKVSEISRIRGELLAKGATLPPEKSKGEHFDSNCITPGTPFMDRLAKCLHYYVHDRLNSDPAWKNIQVILSDANVPGEGEHKIMDYIRRQRGNPDHDPNTHHCLCGADADLIMLGLATHEPNFTIIREEFKPNQPRGCDICGQEGHEMKDCTGAPREKQGQFDELSKPVAPEQAFIFLRLCVLREYLERELTITGLPFEFEFERALDDWVMMCFFVGNDFLPHLPSLEIREGAIDRLINLYKKTVHKTGGYLTDSGMVNLQRVQLIMTDLGEVEDEIFKKRQDNEIAFRQRMKEKNKRMKLNQNRPAWTPRGQFAPTPLGSRPSPVTNARQEAYQMRTQGFHSQTKSNMSNLNAAQALKAMMTDGTQGANANQNEQSNRGEKRKADEGSDEEEEPLDDVRLWEDGWKDRYYQHKFDISVDNIKFRQAVAAAYTLGLCWVLRYYYQGCASWKWYFPYHYAPFASDFINIGDLNCDFEFGTQPFNPLEQLMGVFPAASKQHLPDPWGCLMDEVESPIIDFYPIDFKIDLNGKKYAWQGVALLPFVEEKRLLDALKDVYPLLTDEERRRNVRGDDRLYISESHPGYSYLKGLYEGCKDYDEIIELIPKLFEGMSGTILLARDVVEPGGELQTVVPGLPKIQDNRAICTRFRDPKYADDFIFPAKRLEGAVEPLRVLKPQDLDRNQSRNWRPQIGMVPSNQRAYLDTPGRRMLNHNMRSNAGQGAYSSVPPPDNMNNSSNSRRGWRGGSGGMGRGGQMHQQNYGSGYQQKSYSGGQSGYGGQSGGGGRDTGHNMRGAYNRSGGGDSYNQPWSGGYNHGGGRDGNSGGGGGGWSRPSRFEASNPSNSYDQYSERNTEQYGARRGGSEYGGNGSQYGGGGSQYGGNKYGGANSDSQYDRSGLPYGGKVTSQYQTQSGSQYQGDSQYDDHSKDHKPSNPSSLAGWY